MIVLFYICAHFHIHQEKQKMSDGSLSPLNLTLTQIILTPILICKEEMTFLRVVCFHFVLCAVSLLLNCGTGLDVIMLSHDCKKYILQISPLVLFVIIITIIFNMTFHFLI
ncbi:unnamed protein product [Choristocarpus tenellus]